MCRDRPAAGAQLLLAPGIHRHIRVSIDQRTGRSTFRVATEAIWDGPVRKKSNMKQIVGAFVMAALVGLAVDARADQRHPRGYTNADIKGGYGCNVSGTLAG